MSVRLRPLSAAKCAAWRRFASTEASEAGFQTGATVDIASINITKYVLENALKRGSLPAIIDNPTQRITTYQQLPYRVSATMRGLAQRGVREKDVVNIHMPNCSEYVTSWQAIAAMGATSTTSNTVYTSDELAQQYRDSNAKFAITIPSAYQTVKDAAAQAGVKDIFVIEEDKNGAFIAQDAPDGTPLPEFAEVNAKEDVVVLPYSSGTTGLPKGVMLTHHNMVSNVAQIITHPKYNLAAGTGSLPSGAVASSGAPAGGRGDAVVEEACPNDMRAGDVVMGVLPAFHIYGMTVVMLAALRIGATVVMVPKFDPPVFLEAIAKHKVSYMPIVPPIINFLAKHPLIDQFDLSSVRTIFSGAAPLDAETQTAVMKRLKCIVRQGYGMSETSPVTHIADRHNEVIGTIGKPVPNTACKVVNPETEKALLPGKDNVGELWIKGPQVMKGYLNNQKATDEMITKDGWLRTGDLGYYDNDGNFFVVDRLKELIKVKGFQCAPAELEGLLLSHPAIMDAAVVGRKDERSGEVPVAFVVKKRDALKASNHPEAAAKVPDVTAEQVKDHVKQHVAHYKELADVVFIPQIPKSASGKILRRVLRAQLNAHAGAAAPS